ncbi:MAG: DUF72 domain-containing protein [Bacteroidota bacterium]
MEFGRLDRIEGVDFSLPNTPETTINFLRSLPQNGQKPSVFVGCPIWGNKSWRGKVYPEKARERDFLQFYARQFSCIELNTTHYRVPDPTTIHRWRSQTPKSFLFCPKIPQEISHKHFLRHAKHLTEQFIYSVQGLEERLGLCFLQLPPSFAPEHADILISYLEDFPQEADLAIEFRNAEWFDGSRVEDVHGFMRDHGFSSVITDVAGRRDVLHHDLTSDAVAIRFIGNGLHPTDFERTDAWVERISEWTELGLQTIHFWVHQPNNDLAPEMVRYVIRKFNEVLGLSLEEPMLVSANPPAEQGSLF